jgi:hypothetical protein
MDVAWRMDLSASSVNCQICKFVEQPKGSLLDIEALGSIGWERTAK